jgi:hypothetical protein
MEILNVLLSLLGQCYDNTFTDVKTVVSKISSRLIFSNHPTVSHSMLHNLTVTTVVNKKAWGSTSTDADPKSGTQTGKDKEKH